MALKFGKKPYEHDNKTFMFGNYIDKSSLPVPPMEKDWSAKVEIYPMMGNDRVGDCAIAGFEHMDETWLANDGKLVITPDTQVLQEYKDVSGWNGEFDDPSDTGCTLLSVLKYFQRLKRLEGYMQVNPRNIKNVYLATFMFGGLYIGLALPNTCNGVDIASAPKWVGKPNFRDTDTLPNPNNGHCVCIVSYNMNTEMFDVVTWGAKKKMSVDFFQAYCDESWVLYSKSWTGNDGKCPAGFDEITLRRDLKALGH